MKRLPRSLTPLILFVPLVFAGCIFLTNKQLQTLRLFMRTSQNLPAGQLTEVYSSIYPNALTVKNNWVKVFGRLEMAGGNDLPSKVGLTIVSVDGKTGAIYDRFKMTLKIKNNGSFSAIKKFKKNLRAETLQSFLVEPAGSNIPSGTTVSICLDVVKKKGDASSDTTCGPATSTSGGNVVTVEIVDNAFSPKSITIEPGDTVRWVLRGMDMTHTTTEMNDVWDSGFAFASAGATFERTFAAADNGKTFEYQCSTHKACCQMQGSVRVGNSAPPPPPGY